MVVVVMVVIPAAFVLNLLGPCVVVVVVVVVDTLYMIGVVADLLPQPFLFAAFLFVAAVMLLHFRAPEQGID